MSLSTATSTSIAYPRDGWTRFGQVLALLFLVAAALYLANALCAIVNFAWQHPFLDQFRLYDFYLSLPFPENALQLENGHRPVIPALLRLAEIHWLNANQKLQIGLGAGCAFTVVLIVAATAWRTTEMPIAARAAAVMVAVLGILWLANARMLLHGNEALHAYLIIVSVVIAAMCTYRAGHQSPWRWMLAASICCIVATFSFGTGIASFPAILVLAWLQRVHWRQLLLPLAGMFVCLGIYLYALPGDSGVRGQLDFRPGALAIMSARWLSSPWIVGWLGLGDSELYGWAQGYLRASPLSGSLIAVAEAVEQWSGMRWTHSGGVWIGCAGIGTFAFLLLERLRTRQRPDRMETVALALCLFGLATALVICLGRLTYLEELPMQAFADRYLLWPCLFWLGLVLLLLRRFTPQLRGARLYLVLCPLLLLPLIAQPSHKLWTGWGATVYRNTQQSAASARSDALDERHFGSNGAVSADVTLRALQLLRERKLAMYAQAGTEFLGQTFTGELQKSAHIAAQPLNLEALQDMRDGQPIARFEGFISSGISAAREGGFLAVLDAQNRIVGFADFSFIRPGATAMRFDMPKKRGFDGYIRHFDAAARYRLVLLGDMHQNGVLLYEFQ